MGVFVGLGLALPRFIVLDLLLRTGDLLRDVGDLLLEVVALLVLGPVLLVLGAVLLVPGVARLPSGIFLPDPRVAGALCFFTSCLSGLVLAGDFFLLSEDFDGFSDMFMIMMIAVRLIIFIITR